MALIYDSLILAKLETTKGVDAVPVVGTNAVRVKSFKLKKNNVILARKVIKQTMGELPHLIGKETVSLEMMVELRGSGVAGTPPETSPLLQALRLTETIVASTSVTYKPTTLAASEKSATIYVYYDGLLWKLLGAVGTAKIDATIDGVVIINMTFQAAYAVPTVVACPTGAVFMATQPNILSSAAVFNDGAVIKVGKFGIDLANKVDNHYVTGENSFVVADRQPTMTFGKDSINTAAEWANLTAGSTISFSAAVGVTAGNLITITAPVGKRKDIVYAERAERVLTDMVYALYESASDDQYSIALT